MNKKNETLGLTTSRSESAAAPSPDAHRRSRTLSHKRRRAPLRRLVGGLAALLAVLSLARTADAAPSYVQSGYTVPQSPQVTVSVPFTAAQAAGDLNVVIVGWYDTTSSVVSVTDSRGHVYARAVGPTTQAAAGTQSIYYAAGIGASAAGTNTVTVTFSAAVPYPDVRIAEYAGVDALNAVDGAVAGTGTGTLSDTGAVATSNANDLLVAGTYVTSATTGAGAGYTQRLITNPDGSILEDRVVTATGSYVATAPLASGSWIMQMVAFRGQSAAADTSAPTNPSGLTATAASSAQVSVSWTASTDNVGVTGYLLERCQGAGCSSFAQIATPTGTTYSDTAVTGSTSYSYRVRARDAANNQSGYSNTASATTPAAADTSPPTNPSGLAATAVSSAQVSVSWTASTDNVGVTGYLLERCQGAGCSSFAQIATPAGTTYSDTAVTGSTSYSYRVRARDAANNQSGYSNTASATTPAAADTSPPTNPSGLTATAISSAQVSVSWTASTDNVGVTGYLLERCQGAGCSSFAQIATPTGTTYSDTAVTESTSYSYRVRARDAANNQSGYSNTASATTQAAPDTSPPTVPSGLTATAVSSSQIDIGWSASTDNVGVTGYLLERCIGAGCSTFVQIATPVGTAFNDSGLSASTNYTYRVRARDAANNQSGFSNTAGATTLVTASAPLTYVQSSYAVPQSPQATVSVPFTAAQAAGDLNVVIVGWYDTTSSVVSVTDSRGHVYARAVGPTTQAAAGTQSIYYAAGIGASAAGTNTVTVTFSAAVPYPDVRIAEYAGVDALNAVDGAVAGTGTGTLSDSGAVATSNANDLLVAGTYVTSATTGAGAGYTQRLITNPDGSILEDRVVTVTGSYAATAPMASGTWIMQMVAFRGQSAVADTSPPTNPSGLTATAASSAQVSVSWTASTDDVGVTGYLLERCQGAGCSSFAQIAIPTGTTYSDTAVTGSTSYSYRVRARDAANNQSGYSNTASATTPAAADTSPPTNPSGLTATAVSSAQVSVSWTASTDNVGVTGYLLERCQGAGCSSFAQIATPAGTTYSDAAVTESTSYSYRVRARDAANNQSGYSNTASATTPAAADTSPPTNPSGLTATAISSTQVSVSWTASTDNVGVTGYLLERCQGAGCYSFAQIATPTGTTYSDTAVTGSTSYRYRVRARDAANNQSGYSSTASVTTPAAADTSPPTNPSGLTATAISSAQVSVSWTASTDDVGVTSYVVERCQGAGCGTFTLLTTVTSTSFTNAGLLASTSYSYRVAARDAAGNVSGYSNVAAATTQAGVAPIAYRQGNYATPQAPQSVVTVAFPAGQNLGNLNVVAVGWFDTASNVISVTDTRGNTYSPAVGPTRQGAAGSHSIYYAPNIGSGANEVTVTFNASVEYPDVRIAEYSGIQQVDPVDVVAAGVGTGALSDSGAVITTSGNELLVGANYVTTATTFPGGGYTQRMISTPDGSILEDRVVDAAGNYGATAPLQSGSWIMQMVAFRGGPPAPPDDTAPLISIVTPVGSATLAGDAAFSAIASDSGSGVAGVQFRVDGVNVGPPFSSAPYNLTFSTAQLANGPHVVQAYAWDVAHNVGTATDVPVTFNNAAPGTPAQTGLWSGLFDWPLVAIHVNLLTDGRILAWDRMKAGNANPQVWDSVTGAFTSVPLPGQEDLFCTGQITLPDGRVLAVGGDIATHVGLQIGRIFDPATNLWSATPDMQYGRWYPTATTLPNGRILTLSGEVNCEHCYATVPEIYNPTNDTWTSVPAAAYPWPYYPHTFVIPDGRVLVSSTTESAVASRVLDLNTNTWTVVDPQVVDGYSASMYLPGKILKTGTAADSNGSVPSAATAYVLDMTQASPSWRQVPSMQNPRAYHATTILPDGSVLVTGGGRTTGVYDIPNAVYQAELWSPSSETFAPMSSMHAPRLYHGTAILLADGRVLVAGGGRAPGPDTRDQLSAEIFAPPYLFKGPRPTITTAPTQVTYNGAFTVQTPNAASIAKVTLVAIGNMTHGFNMNQRYLPLAFTPTTGGLSVTAPANANLAPPGYYMLFIVNSAGVPSVASIVHF